MIFVRAKSTFLNSSGLKGVFEKLCFRDGLVWTVGVTVEIKLHIEFLPCSEVGTLKKTEGLDMSNLNMEHSVKFEK